MTKKHIKPKSVSDVIKRTLFGKCPNCGNGKLFKSYLKPVDECGSCCEKLGEIRADDGPAWLSVVILSHIMVPLAIYLATKTSWSTWLIISSVSALALVGTLLLLPPSKGVFIGIIWYTGCQGSNK